MSDRKLCEAVGALGMAPAPRESWVRCGYEEHVGPHSYQLTKPADLQMHPAGVAVLAAAQAERAALSGALSEARQLRLRTLSRHSLDILQGALEESDRIPLAALTELEIFTLVAFADVLAVRAAAAGDDQRHFSVVLCILLQQLLPKKQAGLEPAPSSAVPTGTDRRLTGASDAVYFAEQLVSLFLPAAAAAEVWAEISGIRIHDLHTCRICGCTDADACVNRDGDTCTWVAPNLCSACFDQPLIVAP